MLYRFMLHCLFSVVWGVCVCVILLSLSNLRGNWMQWNLTVMTALHGFVSDISCFVSPSLPTVIGQWDSMSQKLTINITAEVKRKFVVTWFNGGLLMQTNSRQNWAQMQPGVPNAAVSLLCCISGWHHQLSSLLRCCQWSLEAQRTQGGQATCWHVVAVAWIHTEQRQGSGISYIKGTRFVEKSKQQRSVTWPLFPVHRWHSANL